MSSKNMLEALLSQIEKCCYYWNEIQHIYTTIVPMENIYIYFIYCINRTKNF